MVREGNYWGGVQAFHEEAKACMKVQGEMRESFGIQGVRQECMLAPWLFNIYMNIVIREMKAKVGEVRLKLCAGDLKFGLKDFYCGIGFHLTTNFYVYKLSMTVVTIYSLHQTAVMILININDI